MPLKKTNPADNRESEWDILDDEGLSEQTQQGGDYSDPYDDKDQVEHEDDLDFSFSDSPSVEGSNDEGIILNGEESINSEHFDPHSGVHSTELDLEKKRIRDFGSTKGNTLKVSDVSTKKDRKRKKKALTLTILASLALLSAMGVKNTFFPTKPPTTDEIASISQQAVGVTNFPSEGGRAFAENFMKAYLTAGPDTVISNRVLSYYYTGSTEAQSGQNQATDIGKQVTSNYKQTILYDPTVYSVTPINDETAAYTVGALVLPSSSEEGHEPPQDGSTSKWVFFNVNINYNPESNSYAVAPNSPSVVPSQNIEPQSKLGDKKVTIGTGERDKEVEGQIKSTVDGFMEAYAKSTPTSHSSMDQYVVKDAGPELLTGLGDQYDIVPNSIEYEAYPTDVEGQYRVRVNIQWDDKVTGSDKAKATYKSRYILTLVQTSDGRYLVSKASPEYYVTN